MEHKKITFQKKLCIVFAHPRTRAQAHTYVSRESNFFRNKYVVIAKLERGLAIVLVVSWWVKDRGYIQKVNMETLNNNTWNLILCRGCDGLDGTNEVSRWCSWCYQLRGIEEERRRNGEEL